MEKREERKRKDKAEKPEEQMIKLWIKERKQQYAHEIHMAAMSCGAPSNTANFFDSHSLGAGSGYALSQQDEVSTFDGFHGNAVAGSSTTPVDLDDGVNYSQFSFNGFGSGSG
jgi:hypothetical protein